MTKRLKEIRRAFAGYYASEGCDCCRIQPEHDEAEERLANLLEVEKYDDGSGFDWYKYKTVKIEVK